MFSVEDIACKTWHSTLLPFFKSRDYQSLTAALEERRQAEDPIYPPQKQVFAAFNHTPFDKVKVVILGQDPYHGPGQAMGLSFSVPEDEKPPPSLRNILKEVVSDAGKTILRGPDLSPWARQGVLLLN